MRFFRRGAGATSSALATSGKCIAGGMRDMAIPEASSSSSCLRRSSRRADEYEVKLLAAQQNCNAASDGNIAAAGAGRLGTRPKGRHRRGAWRATALIMTLDECCS